MDKGTRLIQLREAKQVSQTEASKFLGLTKQTLYKYEKNIVTNIPSDVVERMAKYYNTTPAYIMGWTDDPNKTAKDLLIDAYMQSARNKEFMELFVNVSPDLQESVVNILKAAQPKS